MNIRLINHVRVKDPKTDRRKKYLYDKISKALLYYSGFFQRRARYYQILIAYLICVGLLQYVTAARIGKKQFITIRIKNSQFETVSRTPMATTPL